MGAAGGIISSVSDMAKWMNFQLANGKIGNEQVLEYNTQANLWTPHNSYLVTESQKQNRPGVNFRGYGLGWAVSDYHGRRVIAHGGGYDGMYSRVLMVPEENLGIVVLTNGMRGISGAITDFVVDKYLGLEEINYSEEALKDMSYPMYDRIDAIKAKRVLNTQPSLSLDDYVGIFYTPMYGNIHIKKGPNGLLLEFEDAPLLMASLTHWHYDTFEIKWDVEHAWFDFGTVQFEFDQARNITGIKIDVPNNDIFFHELELKKVASK